MAGCPTEGVAVMTTPVASAESFTVEVWWALSTLDVDCVDSSSWFRRLDLSVECPDGVAVVGVSTHAGCDVPLADVPIIDMTPGDVRAVGAALTRLAGVLEVLPVTRDREY